MREYGSFYASWLWWWLKDEAREMWRALPGPWWLKLLLCLLCLAIPGPADELGLIVLVKVCRAWRARKEATA